MPFVGVKIDVVLMNTLNSVYWAGCQVIVGCEDFGDEQSRRSPLRGCVTKSVQDPPGMSSTTPLQSLSRPSQTSGSGAPGVQTWGIPPRQLSIVTRQRPRPHIVVPRLSSIWPSQSLSMSSQTSGDGSVFGMQTRSGEWHCVVPVAQSPFNPVVQFLPPPGFASST